jgi:peptide/nickel transport system substrate-binding protein
VIQEPGKGGIGTGPFVRPDASAPNTLTANPHHYLGRPAIDEIVVSSYPTVRAAWADLLRGNLDMLNEVNLDALDSLKGATNVNVFSFVRHYQYMIVFGAKATALRPPEVRRALSAALDRDALVREAMGGHGVPSAGPVPPQHWTMTNVVATRSTALSKTLPSRHLKFTCLVPPDTVYERVALAVKRQLAAVSVEMDLEEATQEQIGAAFRSGNFDALLGDIISGPTLFRSFRFWSSQGNALSQKLTSAEIDAALDRVNRAVSDDEYRAGVAAYQRAITDAPPALFLAWGERARAVSRRFSVPTPAKNGDVFDTRSIRLWRPADDSPVTSTN